MHIQIMPLCLLTLAVNGCLRVDQGDKSDERCKRSELEHDCERSSVDRDSAEALIVPLSSLLYELLGGHSDS